MIMIQGSGLISNYGSYISNCTRGQLLYKVPVNALSDVQLYIAIGATKPTTALYQLIHTCGPNAGTVETLTTSQYVVGQNTENAWYGVFKSLAGNVNPLTCFVIAITLDDTIYFSEEYCVETGCGGLTQLQGCYGNLDNKLSYDPDGVYFGTHAGEDTPLGDVSVRYRHQLLMRNAEVTLAGSKTTFKQGRTRNFRTERQRTYQFWPGEVVPEWYMTEIDAVFYRGEVYVGSTRYLVSETNPTLVEPCKRQWKYEAIFHTSFQQSFSCEADPCAEPVVPCCDPLGVSASVSQESPGGPCCDPEVISAIVSDESPFCQTMIRDGEFLAPGFWYTDKTDLEAFTAIYFSKEDMDSEDIQAWLAELEGKLITITLNSDPSKTATYVVTGVMNDYGTYVGFEVVNISGTPYTMLQDEEYTICYDPVGACCDPEIISVSVSEESPGESPGDSFYVIDEDGSRLLDDDGDLIIYP